MATVGINDLPEQTLAEMANYLIVQDGTDTKKMLMSVLVSALSQGPPGEGVPGGGNANEVLTKVDGTDFNTVWAALPIFRRQTNAISAVSAYTPAVSDENKLVTLSNATAVTVTLPSDATVALPLNAEILFMWFGVGATTFVAGSGATVTGVGLKLRIRNSTATAKKIAANTWVVFGDLIP